MLTGDMLRRSAARFPVKPAIIFRGPEGAQRVLAYRELDAQANQLAHALLALGLPKGAKVSVLSRNLPEYGVVFFGVARTGLVLNNVSILYAADELAWVLNKSDTEVLIVDAAFAERLPAVRAQCPGLRHVVLIGPEQKAASDQSEHAQAAIHFEALIAGQPTTPPEAELDERDPFCMTG